MKTTKWVFFGVLVLFSSAVLAQDYAFQVMINKGANEVKSGSTWTPVKTGASLKAGDEIRLAANAYLGLRHATGKMMEVKQSGVHKVADLASKVNGGSSVLNKYTDFILSSNSAEAKKNRLSATGAVHRGAQDAIQLYLPTSQSSSVFGDKIILNWDSKVDGPYEVQILNMFDDVLAKYETNDRFLELNLTDPKLANNDLGTLLIKVVCVKDPKQSSGDTKMLKRAGAEEQKNVNAQLAELGPSVNEQTAINKYFMAGFYEQNGLVVDAITAYMEAIKLEPAFMEDYKDFLIRKGLKPVEQQ